MQEQYMQRALDLAVQAQGLTSPNPLVGAVIVKNGKILGEGYHRKAGTDHAEVIALKEAGQEARGCTLYVTLEPCSHYGRTPPCVDRIIEAGLRKVSIAMADPNPKVNGQGIEKLREAGIQVEVGLLAEQARCLNEHFLKYITTEMPYVTLKWAMSLDGKIATATGEYKWISGPASLEFTQNLRKNHDGILVGINTVLNDDPELIPHLEGNEKFPLRIILDSDLRIPLEAKVLKEQKKAKTLLIARDKNPNLKLEKVKYLEEQGIEVIFLKGQQGKLPLPVLLSLLGKRNITSILVEGGGTVHEAFLKENLADKLYAFIAPKIIGGKDAKTPVEGLGIAKLEEAYLLEDLEMRQLGKDVLLAGYLRR